MTGILAGAAAPGLAGRLLMSGPVRRYLTNQRLAGRLTADPIPPTAPGTAIGPVHGRGIAPWQTRYPFNQRAVDQTLQRFPWLATGAIPHVNADDGQQRARGGALKISYRAKRKRRADGGGLTDDDVVLPPASAMGTVGPSYARQAAGC